MDLLQNSAMTFFGLALTFDVDKQSLAGES